ncbi:MAG: ECF transporter S component [Firmicutes bacterium HGW-Firmicutes-21]|nr:MAG: ECF transporter S component [Firmicutes bacterium HGW-Firmicutes-21]
MDTKKTLLWITRTGVLIALLVALQWGLGSMTGNNQLVVGSAVNLVLIVAVVLSGLYSGAAVAVVSPFTAYMFGIGTTFIALVPFIALGNLSLIIVWFLITKKAAVNANGYIKMVTALVLGALIKLGLLYFTVVKLAIPFILNVNEKQAAVLSANFSLPQLVTASIGGAIAILIIPVVKKAIK